MTSHLLVAAGVLALLTVAPGPDMAVVARQAVAGGRSDGFRTVLGVAAGLLLWGLLTAVGLAALLAASATAFTVVKFAGAAYLVFLGIRSLLNSRRPEPNVAEEPARREGGPWVTGAVTNTLNPKVAVFYIGLLPTLAPPQLSPQAGMALLVLTHVMLTVIWLGGFVFLLDAAKAFFARSGVRRWMDRITGAVLITFGLRIAAAQP
ncbi:LysE family translocator [Nocardiopsis algeriensis]|uniref:Threonine/homoserine/homoserine lactone efflux protein n=1 Tax=Nocardiopsis algeriensis TaxID=1478215 RepID=A0A841IUS2_9ACTN|nr:LysE family translocator [Nocardiopsis algeriensis]MBB6120295.1 threonine/homoserine/homoserine lactone efflux protein [Nocardiopsis algeriensis]